MIEQDKQLLNDVLASENFSEQEKQIIKGRFEKAEKREAILDKYQQDYAAGTANVDELLAAIEAISDEECEHGRTMMVTCYDCFTLEKKVANLHPEWFKNDPGCADLFGDDEQTVN